MIGGELCPTNDENATLYTGGRLIHKKKSEPMGSKPVCNTGPETRRGMHSDHSRKKKKREGKDREKIWKQNLPGERRTPTREGPHSNRSEKKM